MNLNLATFSANAAAIPLVCIHGYGWVNGVRPTLLFRIIADGLSLARVYGSYTCLLFYGDICTLAELLLLHGTLLAAARHLAYTCYNDIVGAGAEAGNERPNEQAAAEHEVQEDAAAH